jgi:hypothetical protein
MPNGRAGWVHRTTLEAVKHDPAPMPAAEGATAPAAAQEIGTDEPDPRALDQLLAAIVAQRQAALAAAALAADPPEDARDSTTGAKRHANPARGTSSRSARPQGSA